LYSSLLLILFHLNNHHLNSTWSADADAEEDTSDAEVRATLSGAPVSLGMDADKANAFELANSDDEDMVQDQGIVAKVMTMFTDVFGGAVSPRGSDGLRRDEELPGSDPDVGDEDLQDGEK
jgi:hypothetical protein